jgi:hypothetical protein
VAANQQLGVLFVMGQIDNVVANFGDNPVVLNVKKRKINTRPDNWRLIVEHVRIYGIETTVKDFKEDLSIYSDAALRMNLKRWKKDLAANKTDGAVINSNRREPVYGIVIDLELLADVQATMLQGLPLDSVSLRRLLVERLRKAQKLTLLREHGNTAI